MKPKFLGGDEPDVAGKDRRVVLAEWLASPENPYFATNLSQHRLGPLLRPAASSTRWTTSASATRPSNPELLDELGKQFTEYKYDFKKLVRDICTSRTYQRSTQPNDDATRRDARNFAHGADPPHPGRDPARLHQRR